MIRHVAFFLCVSAVVSACGSSSSDDSGSGKPSIVGTWKSDCIADSSSSAIVTLVNTDTQSVYTATAYSDKTCLSLSYIQTSTRTYSIGDAVSGLTNAYQIDFTYSKVEMVYKTQSVTDAANTAKAYGSTDWALNVTKDVSGKKLSDSSARAAYSNGEVFYTIIKVDGSDYYGGDNSTGDGTSAAKRATSLATSVKLKKQ